MSEEISISDPVLTKFKNLATQLSKAHIRADAKAKATHEHFNVFTTVLKATDEVRLHTRFIHCLLDPQGSHDCGTLFLELFFETLNQLQGLDHTEKKTSFEAPARDLNWTVFKEASRPGFGQMDILLESAAQGIAIENKIGALEQPNQVSFYAKYLQRRFGKNSLVIYLTLDGKQSSTAEGEKYLRISYGEHILTWLEKCLQKTYRIIPINQVILQYREVIRQLTSRTLDIENMQPIIQFVIDNPDILRFRSEIAQATEAAIQHTWSLIEEGIKSDLPADYEISICRRASRGRFGNGLSAAIVIVPERGNVLREAPFEIWAEQDESDFGVGVVPRGDWENLSPQDEMLFQKMRDFIHPDKGTTPRFPLGWKNLILGVDDKNFAEVVRNPNIDGMCDIIRNYVGEVEGAYLKAREKQI